MEWNIFYDKQYGIFSLKCYMDKQSKTEGVISYSSSACISIDLLVICGNVIDGSTIAWWK
jgi:hypothetical protein